MALSRPNEETARGGVQGDAEEARATEQDERDFSRCGIHEPGAAPCSYCWEALTDIRKWGKELSVWTIDKEQAERHGTQNRKKPKFTPSKKPPQSNPFRVRMPDARPALERQ